MRSESHRPSLVGMSRTVSRSQAILGTFSQGERDAARPQSQGIPATELRRALARLDRAVCAVWTEQQEPALLGSFHCQWAAAASSAKRRPLARSLLIVVHTIRGERIRLISARSATKHERRKYEETSL